MRTSKMVLTALAVLGLALAGCGGDDEEPSPSTPGATGGGQPPSPGAGEVASCVAGDWRSTGVGEQADGTEGIDLQLGGGGGVSLEIAQDGAATLDFTGMEPIDISGSVASVDVAGTLVYSGSATATLQTFSDTAQEQEQGTWQPSGGEPDFSGVRVTLEVTEPVEGTPLDDTPLGEGLDQAEEWIGQVVDVNPILGEGSYQCQPDGNLLLTSGDDIGTTWTFAPA